MTFVLSNPIPQIAKVPAILEFLGKLRHAFLAVVFDKIFSFFKIRASSFDNNAKEAYGLMIKYVSQAEKVIRKLKVKKIKQISFTNSYEKR